MRQRLILVALLLGLLGSSWTTVADTNPLSVIVLEPGYTEFSMGGQDFFCITPERIRIQFSQITPLRVRGRIFLLGEYTSSPVKLVWVSAGRDPLDIFDSCLQAKITEFDSGVTGHNEKIE